MGLNQQERNEIIITKTAENVIEPDAWETSKFYKDSNGQLTEDDGTIRWLSNLILENNTSLVDIYGLESLSHLENLSLQGDSAMGDTFEHNGLTINTYEFINELAENCYKNTGKKLTVNLKGTSITTITKNKINTTYCTLQSDV